MERKTMRVWYDRDLDSLEVQWEEGYGFYTDSDDDRILMRVNEQGETLGFMVEHVSALDSLEPATFEVGGPVSSGPKDFTVSEAANQRGVSVRRMRELCAAGRVRGAERKGRDWIIPAPIEITPGGRGPIGVAGDRRSSSNGRSSQ